MPTPALTLIGSPSKMTESQLEELFREWWKQSFPNSPPGKHALATHIGWAQHILAVVNYEQQQKEQPR